MIKAGSPVSVHYDNGDFYAILATFDTIPERQKLGLFNELVTRELTFTVKFVENNEVSYDIVSADYVSFQYNKKLQCYLIGNPQPLVVSMATYFHIVDTFREAYLADEPLVNDALQYMPYNGNLLGYFPGVPSPGAGYLYGNEFVADYSGFVDSNGDIVRLGNYCYSYLYDYRGFYLYRVVYCRTNYNQTYSIACGIAMAEHGEVPVFFPLETVVLAEQALQFTHGVTLYNELAYCMYADGILDLERPFEFVYGFYYGVYYVWYDALFLSRKYSTLAPATPVEILLCQAVFKQNAFYDIAGDKELKLKLHKYSASLYHTYVFPGAYDQLYAVDYIAVLNELLDYAKYTGVLTGKKIALNDSAYRKLHEHACAYKQFCCGFCGKRIGYENMAGPYLHSLIYPASDSAIGIPVLVAFHRNCVCYVPEVELQTKDEKIDDYFEIVDDPIISIAILDRRLRKAGLIYESEVFLNLRLALANERMGNKCSVCGKVGAVIGCWNNDCKFTAHYDCVLDQHLSFTDYKVLFCKRHQK